MFRSRGRWRTAGPALLAACLVGGASAAAQGPGAPPFGGRPGGPPRFGGPGRFLGPIGGPRTPTAVQVPTPVLSRALKLTASQRARVDALQRQFRERVRAAFRPPAPGGPPPDPQAFRASITRVRGLEQATSAKIVALLSKDQKRSLARLLSDIGDFRVVGFPPDAGSVLTLSAKQRQRIGAIAARTRQASQKAAARARSPWEAGPAMMQARQRAHSDALAVLTGAQRSALERARRERRPFGAGGPFGAPGRPGPFGGRGGPGGPPPPRQAPL